MAFPAFRAVFASLLICNVIGFAPSYRVSSWIRLRGSVVPHGSPSEDWSERAEKAYEDAEAAVAKFGITSPEARLAWEVVDDLENPSSAVVAEVPRPLDEECDVELDEAKCRDFEMKMGKLEELANSAKTINYQIKYEILKLQGFPVASTMASAAAVSSSNYQEAKAAAEEAAKTHGANSKEAAVAWEAVFEIVSAAADDKVPMGSLEDVCLLDSASAKCVEYTTAMDQLKAAIKNKELA